MLLGSALVVLVSAGCAKKENTESSSAGQGVSSNEAAPPTTGQPPTEHGGGNEQADTSGSVVDIISRVHDQEHQLDRIIANAQLSEVHNKAFAIRDLIVAAAEKAGGSEASRAKLQGRVEVIRKLASELDEAGVSGDLERTKSKYQELQLHLRAIEGALGMANP